MTEKKRTVIGVTEPSKFTDDCITMIEEFFDATPLKMSFNKTEDINYFVDQCSGIILAGGVDIHPSVYGRNILNNCGFGNFDLKRDIREVNIVKRCFEKKIPVLGICRGFQLLGVMH